MTQTSGWYDDPQDPTQLRYWDGVVWSSHVSPKVSPTVEQSTIGMPYGVVPASARAQSSGLQGAQGRPTVQDVHGSHPSGGERPGEAGGQQPSYGQWAGAPAGRQPGWQSHPATTPDGVPLSSWWLRVGARVLDSIFTFVLALPITGWFYVRYFTSFMDWSKELAAQSTSAPVPVTPFPPWDTLQYVVFASLVSFLVAGVYEVLFLSRRGATPGKSIVGISVRLRDQAGPPPMRAALLRTVCFFGLQLLSLTYLLDVLWPLWDDKRQALHDKAAATNVVVGPQRKRNA